jgi:hypothetical protein
MNEIKKNQNSEARKKELDLNYLRGAITPAPQLIPKNAFNYDY